VGRPWDEAGWRPAVDTWPGTVLPGLGYRPVGAAVEVKNWPLSCVLRQPTDRGYLYVKATVDTALFVPEAAVLPVLTELFGEQVVGAVAADAGLGVVVMADFGAELGWGAPPVEKAGMLAEWDGVAAPATIGRAWQLAQVLMPANQAISYISIEQDVGPVEGFGEATTTWLRRLLAAT
jgi:hypothetical protein